MCNKFLNCGGRNCQPGFIIGIMVSILLKIILKFKENMEIESQSRDVFYVSDGTAITCETLGHVVLGQFPFKSKRKNLPVC